MDEGENIVIFDTTLRDGEQSPGCSMTLDEKVRLAKQLEKLGVNVIEAGFAIASDGDFAAIQAVTETCRETVSEPLPDDRRRRAPLRRFAEIRRFPAHSYLCRHFRHSSRIQIKEIPRRSFADDLRKRFNGS